MGSKNLKAIAVRGQLPKPYHDNAKLNQLRAQFARDLMGDPVAQRLHDGGTAFMLEPLNAAGILPTRNFRDGAFDGAADIGSAAYNASILAQRDTCTGCPVRCKPEVSTEAFGTTVERRYGGPEYETLAAFGSLCLVADLPAIALANQKCNAYGLDTVSTGSALAFLMEATERGLVNPGLKWGDAKAAIELIDDIAYRRGKMGDRLANGVKALAEDLGVDFAAHVKGVELPLHDPRGKKGLGISYATSPRGATHLEGYHDTSFASLPLPLDELGLLEPKDPLSWQDKGTLQATFENLQSFTNSLVMCRFVSFLRVGGTSYPYPAIREMIGALTGETPDADEMLSIGERNCALAHYLAARNGYSRADDGLPSRLMEPLQNGPLKGEKIAQQDLDRALDEYYEARGYDEFGPTDATLQRLGLDELVGQIHRE
jgi:aldehyde:ferredoxin oxidoreductase